MIKKLTFNDIYQVARIHRQELSGFLPELGGEFLRKFYKVSLNIPEMFTFVDIRDNKVLGFVSGVENSNGLYKKVFFYDLIGFGYLLLKYFITRPKGVVKLMQTTRYPGFAVENSELLTLAVSTSYQRQGIGRRLFLRVAKEFQKRKSNKFRVSVYDRLPANQFYHAVGCRFDHSFDFLGEKMNYYSYVIPYQ